MPYGSHANVPEDFMAVLFQLSAQEQNRVVLPISIFERPHPIGSGEVVYYHPVTGSQIHFKNNGDIDVTTKANVNVSCDNANVTCLTKATVTAPNIDLIGNVSITGTLDVGGVSNFAANVIAQANVAVSGALTQGGTDVGKNHGHSQGSDSRGDAQVNTGGVS
jgi:phage baseplate assembly protein gpV